MTDNDLRMMLQRVISEIKTLREQNAQLRPQAEAYETVTQILGLLPRRSRGMGEDIVWKLERELEALQPKVVVEDDGA